MLFEKLDEKKVFRDSIHRNINVEYKIIWDLINSDVVQRLRRIHQLGGTYMVFSCAEHSRFTHSLGVYEVVNRIVNEVDAVSNVLSNREKLVALCAALLHDIGHGPFSHAFENVFDTNHELMSIRIIKEVSSVNQILNYYDKRLALEVASVIDKTHTNELIIQLVSSQVDADRMDYLLRDSYNCGVTYGNFDLERIMRSMVVVDNRLAFKESGVHALEDYIFARYHMYWQVYLHPTASSYEIILMKILKRFVTLYNNNYQFKTDIKLLIAIVRNDITIEDYLRLDEASMLYLFSEFINEDDHLISNLSSCFINRRLFKVIDYKDLKVSLEELEPDEEKRSLFFEQVVLKNNFYKYYGRVDAQSILVYTKKGELKELYSISELVGAIVNSAKTKTEDILYYHPDYKVIINGKS